MGKAVVFFAMGAGGYARIFPTQNFKALMDPVLRACGDHWYAIRGECENHPFASDNLHSGPTYNQLPGWRLIRA